MEHKHCRCWPQPNFAHFSPPHRMDPKSSCCLIKSKNFPFKISCVLVDKFQMKVNYFAYVLQSVGFFEKFSFALPSLRNAMWQYQTFRYEFLKVRIQELIMLRFDSNAMYLHMYKTVLMVSLMAHLHIIISIKSPCFIAPAFATEARVFIYPSPGTQFSSSFTYLQGKNETFQGYGLVVSLIFKFLCRHNFMFIKNCKRFGRPSLQKN